MKRTDSTNTARLGSGYLVPKCATLDNFGSFVSEEDGVSLFDLPPQTRLLLKTSNSEYLVTIIDPMNLKVIVSGGSYFVIPTHAVIWGASLGGALIRSGAVRIGFQLELAHQSEDGKMRKIITSTVDHLFIVKQ